MTSNLEQVYLMTSDLETSIAFYRDALDLDVARRGERSAEFDTGACMLKVEADFDPETLAEFGLEPPADRRGSGAIIVLQVDDVEATCDSARDAGAEVLIEPRDVPWGRRMFLVRDPEGYVLEVSRPTE